MDILLNFLKNKSKMLEFPTLNTGCTLSHMRGGGGGGGGGVLGALHHVLAHNLS